jgi:hypothetical protein
MKKSEMMIVTVCFCVLVFFFHSIIYHFLFFTAGLVDSKEVEQFRFWLSLLMGLWLSVLAISRF